MGTYKGVGADYEVVLSRGIHRRPWNGLRGLLAEGWRDGVYSPGRLCNPESAPALLKHPRKPTIVPHRFLGSDDASDLSCIAVLDPKAISKCLENRGT